MWREIGSMMLIVLKAGGAVLTAAILVMPIFNRNRVVGVCALYAVVLAGLIVHMSYRSYQSKKKDQERNRKWEEDRLKWEEAARRLRADKTA